MRKILFVIVLFHFHWPDYRHANSFPLNIYDHRRVSLFAKAINNWVYGQAFPYLHTHTLELHAHTHSNQCKMIKKVHHFGENRFLANVYWVRFDRHLTTASSLNLSASSVVRNYIHRASSIYRGRIVVQFKC